MNIDLLYILIYLLGMLAIWLSGMIHYRDDINSTHSYNDRGSMVFVCGLGWPCVLLMLIIVGIGAGIAKLILRLNRITL